MGVPSERRPREGRADAGGARPTQFVRRSPSARGLRRPDWHPSRRPCGLGRETAAPPPHISGLRPEAERWPLPHERLKARTLARGSWEVHGRATPRTATEGRCPPTIPRNSPGNWPIIRNHIQIEDLFQTRPSQVWVAVLGSQREETLQPSESRNNKKRHSGIYNKTTGA